MDLEKSFKMFTRVTNRVKFEMNGDITEVASAFKYFNSCLFRGRIVQDHVEMRCLKSGM